MNIINILTFRHMKLNKRRTMVTIVGVILSVAMLTAVPTFVTSFLDMMQRNAIANTGNWHVLYKNVRVEDADLIINDDNTDFTTFNKDIGYALLEGSKNKYKPYLFVESYNEEGFTNLNLKGGRFPNNSNEVLISSHIEENGGVKYKVGDTLSLDIGERYKADDEEDISLGQDYGFIEATDDNPGEKLITKSSKEYTITGIIDRPDFEQYSAPGYTIITYLDKSKLGPQDRINISVAWKNISRKANKQANKLAEDIGVYDNNLIYNRELLRFYGIIGIDVLASLYTLAAIVITLIIIGSVSLIYNAFAISVSERSRHLGMLGSIGATGKQKRNSVFFEGFIIAIIGIPLGIFFGTIGMGITFHFVAPLIQDLSNQGAKLMLVTSTPTIIVTLLLSAITIFISAYIPAKRASKISPIDAIRQSQDINLTGKDIKTSKITRAIFGFEAELGLKNLKRNSRKYKATIFSLIISIVLFLSVSSLSLFSQRSAEIIDKETPYDIKLSVTSSATAQEKKDFYTVIAEMEYADESVIEQSKRAVVDAESTPMSDEIKRILELDYEGQETQAYGTYFTVQSVDDVALTRYAKEIGIDLTDLKDTINPRGILVNTITMRVNNKYRCMDHFNIQKGEKLKLKYLINGESGEFSTMLETAVITDHTPIGETILTGLREGLIIVSEDVYASMQAKLPEGSGNTNVSMFIKSSNTTSLIESINEYQKQTEISRVHIYDAATANKTQRQFNIFLFVFFYGFVILITAICVANIFNTISTNISLRKREFAMLKSMGMTPKGFNKMINYESLFYGIKALTYGLPISFGMMYLIYMVLGDSFGINFAIPWGSVLGTIIAVFLIVRSTMLYASSKIKKENIIDALKNENI